VVGFSSLALLAMNLPCTPHLIAPMFDARKSEVYAALYRLAVLPEPVVPDAVLSPARFLSCIDSPTLFLGDGALRYRDLIRSTVGDLALFPPWNADLPRASAGAVIALHAALLQNFTPLAELNPTYLRASEAELARRQRESP
jgi:tRNA threonylcarbamoyladenosine biosynthesis protein TsaB